MNFTVLKGGLANKFFPSILRVLFRFYASTWRVRVKVPGRSTPIAAKEYRFDRELFAHIEQDLLVLSDFTDRTPFTVMIAESREGDLMAATLRRSGSQVARGSSLRRGGAALRAILSALERRRIPAAICVDGPLGPWGKAKPGILVCSEHSGRPIIPLGCAVRPAFRLRSSWSKMLIPWPFARIVVVVGTPWVPPEARSREARLAAADELSHLLQASRAEAARLI